MRSSNSIVRRRDEAEYGEYRTKTTILAMYDQMKSATDGGEGYQTGLTRLLRMREWRTENRNQCSKEMKVK